MPPSRRRDVRAALDRPSDTPRRSWRVSLRALALGGLVGGCLLVGTPPTASTPTATTADPVDAVVADTARASGTAGAGDTGRAAGAVPLQPAEAPADTDAQPAYTPRTELLWTDPVTAPTRIRDQLVRLVDATPPGESIQIATYFLGSRPIVAALVAAHERGVAVRLLTDRRKRRGHPQVDRLVTALNVDRTDDSWVRMTTGSSRGRGGVMHQKSYQFSRVGEARHVTVVGSYNTGAVADRRSYALMHQVVAKPVYDAFAAVFVDQARDRDTADTFRRGSGARWTAYFFPAAPSRSPASDPVMRRLGRIPAGPRTTIRIAMFSMWDARGDWVARRLASMARRGADIRFVAGPTVSPTVVDRLAGAGVRVHIGCFADGTFVHAKDMTASYVRNGRRVRWTWVGSDNWTTNGMESDEAVLGLRGRVPYTRFGRVFRTITQRPGAVPLHRCDPM